MKAKIKTHNGAYRNFIVNGEGDISALEKRGHFSFGLTPLFYLGFEWGLLNASSLYAGKHGVHFFADDV